MSLRELKKEIEDLPNIMETIDKFQSSWVEPISETTNHHLPFLTNLNKNTRETINPQLKLLQKQFSNLKRQQYLNDKLRSYARHLIDLKLTKINHNRSKAKTITKHLLEDEVFNISKTIKEIVEFEKEVKTLKSSYNQINEILQSELNLEQNLVFTELNADLHFKTLLETTRKQKLLIKSLGKEFVSLVRELKPVSVVRI